MFSANVGPMHLINLVKVAERQDHIEWFNLPERIFYNRGCLEEGLRECKKTYATGDRDERVIIISGRTNKKLGQSYLLSIHIRNLKAHALFLTQFQT